MTVNAAECLDERQEANLRINRLITDFDRAYNLTDSLGEAVVTECAAFLRHEGEVVERLTDANKCSYLQYRANKVAVNECAEKSLEQRSLRLQLIDWAPSPREFYVNAQCRWYTTATGRCRLLEEQCRSDEV